MATGTRVPRRAKPSYHHGELRKALLDQARALIREDGLEGFTLREVARRAGVSHTAAYRHFADKGALAVEIAQSGYGALAKALGAPLGSVDGLTDRLQELSRRYLTFALRHPADYRVMFGPRLNESGQHPQLEVAIGKLFLVVEGQIFAGLDTPADQRRDISVALLTQAHGFCHLVHERRIRVRSQQATLELFARITQPFFEGVAGQLGV